MCRGIIGRGAERHEGGSKHTVRSRGDKWAVIAYMRLKLGDPLGKKP